MDIEDGETVIDAAYRYLSSFLGVRMLGVDHRTWAELEALLRQAYATRGLFDEAISDAEKALGIEPK